MKKIKRSSELLWLMGILLVGLGVALCSKANLGVSMIAAPAFILNEALTAFFPWLSVGTTEYICQGILLVIMCIIIRHFDIKYILAFGVAVLYGLALDMFLFIFSGLSPESIAARYILLFAGILSTATGVACFFRTYMPLQVYELFVAELSSKKHIELTKVKSLFDKSLFTLSIILAVVIFKDIASFDWKTIAVSNYHSMGMGTLITTIVNSPLILWTGKLVDRIFDPAPAFPKLYEKLKRE